MTDVNVQLINQMRSMQMQSEGAGFAIGENKTPFSLVFQQALDQVSYLDQTANSLRTRFELDDPNVSLADTMIATQKANLGFEATVRFRNQVVDAYKEIMDMPV